MFCNPFYYFSFVHNFLFDKLYYNEDLCTYDILVSVFKGYTNETS